MTPQEREKRQAEAYTRWYAKPEVKARRAEYHKQWYIKNRIKILEACKQYRAKPEVIARSTRPEVKARHIEAVRRYRAAKRRQWYVNNRTRILYHK
jgi:hypothetical protein